MNIQTNAIRPGMASVATVEEVQNAFSINQTCTYLNNASIAPISKNVASAMSWQASLHASDVQSLNHDLANLYAETRELAASLFGSQASRIGFIQNTSHGISLLANGQSWQPGDNVVISADEFPSNYLPWERLTKLGVEVRKVELEETKLTPSRVAGAVDQNTRIVSLSEVQYFNGYRVDLAAISEICKSVDAMLIVDGTQSVGALEIDADSLGLDALVVSSHKWLLGPLGIGFMALSERMLERTEVTQLGWLSVKDPFAFNRAIDLPNSADKFECGTENSAGIVGLNTRLKEIKQFGMSTLQFRIFELHDQMIETVAAHGLTPVTVHSPLHRSGITSFQGELIQKHDIVSRLAEAGIHVSLRRKCLRVSPHYYNSKEEIQSLGRRLGEL